MQFTIPLQGLTKFASEFWKICSGHKVFAFHGEMGAGKTTLIIALCKEMGVHDVIGSPTFSIINEYMYSQNGVDKSIFHIDLYRLKNEQEIEQTGVADSIFSGEICLVEWPEKAPNLFDENCVHVYITAVDDSTRSVCLKVPATSITEQS